MIKVSGIYQIQSKIKPNRIYIGSSVHIIKRWNNHCFYLKKNNHGSSKLQRHYNKYGINDLGFSVLLFCEEGELLESEQFFIDTLNPFFNTSPIAGSSFRGLSHTEETKQKQSKSMLGKNTGKRSRESIEKQRISCTGKRASEETKQKMRDAWRKRSPMKKETKIKISKAKIKYNIPRPSDMNDVEYKKYRARVLRRNVFSIDIYIRMPKDNKLKTKF